MSERVVCERQLRVALCNDKHGVFLTDDDGDSICIGWPHVQDLIDALTTTLYEYTVKK